MNDKKNLDELKTEDTDKTIPKDTEIKWESNTTLKDNVGENNYMYNDPTTSVNKEDKSGDSLEEPIIMKEEKVVPESKPIEIKEELPLVTELKEEKPLTDNNIQQTKKTNILLILLFIFLLIFVIFLPQITGFFKTFSKNMELNSLKKPVPTASSKPVFINNLSCDLKKVDETTKEETLKTYIFSAVEGKLKQFTLVTKLTVPTVNTVSSEVLKLNNSKCQLSASNQVGIDGLITTCTLTDTSSLEKMIVDLTKVKETDLKQDDKVITLDYKLDQNIKEIKESLVASKFICTND
ncbi:MAG: hypothetical protein RSA48_01480 [Bacilli bacterium]